MALWLSRKSAVIRVSKYGTGGGRGGMCFVNGSSGQVHAPRDTSDMGVTFSSLWGKLFTRKETKVLILGLDNAGKSTILYRITMGSVVASAPTVGSNHEIYDYKGVRFGLIDIGGQTSLRSSWSQYFAGTTAIILVIDSSDGSRLPLAKAELAKLVKDDELRTAVLLVLANKQDLPVAQGRLTPAQVSEALSLTDLREREWQIMGCSALTGEGLFEGMDWLVSKLAS